MAKKKAPKRPAAKPSSEAPKRPKNQVLAGMEDSVIQELEDQAHHYVEARDARMGASKIEIEEKGTLLALMHKHKKRRYFRNGLEIEIVVEKEKLRVRTKDSEADEDGDADE